VSGPKPAEPACPICERPALAQFKPFCSPRCADVDLGRWLTGAYAIPVPPDEAGDDEPPAPPQPVRRGYTFGDD
jgi:endogenous inhibitor of DNA gyrase (YacG/DUF329 family)